MKRIGFFWDFHGVLEKDNVKAVVEYCNIVLKKFGCVERITVEQAAEWYGQSWYDYFKNIYPQGNDSTWKDMVHSVYAHQEKNVDIIEKHIRPRDHVHQVLDSIVKAGHHNIVVSNTRPEHIRMFTDMISVTSFFKDIIGVDNHLEARIKKTIHVRKSEVLADYLKNNKSFEKIIMVGDQESDILAGKQNGAVTYRYIDPLMTLGIWNGQTQADYVIHDLRDVLREL